MKNKIYLIIIFIIGIILRVHTAFIQPLWLDEVYSLYFASNFSYLQIIFRLPDCHPGLFYFILKFLLNFSTSTIVLRTIVGIIPQIIGCYIIHSHFKKPLLTTAFLINPLFIHLAWQIRMYSLVFLITILIISLITKSNFSIIKLIVLLFLGNLVSYSFIIPSLCVILYLSFYKNKKNLLIFFLIIFEFFIFKGSEYKTWAETASWISTPSFNNIGSVILTALGLASDWASQHEIPLFFSILFYISFGYLGYRISKKYRLFYFNVVLSLIITILLSISIPFLSQRYFFYLFIPKVSLFLHLFLLPMSVIFYIYVFKFFNRYQKLIISVLILFWIPTYINMDLNSPYKNTNLIKESIPNTIYLPPSENLRLGLNYTLEDINNISKVYNQAEFMEKQLLQKPPVCDLYSQYSKVVFIDQSITSLLNYQNQIKFAIDSCSNYSNQPKFLDK